MRATPPKLPYRLRRIRSFALLLLVTGALAACNEILGTPFPVMAGDDGGTQDGSSATYDATSSEAGGGPDAGDTPVADGEANATALDAPVTADASEAGFDAPAPVGPSDGGLDAPAPIDASEAGPPSCGDAGLELCGDAGCVSTADDAENCGACGHSCLGGTCSSGICQPFFLAGSPKTELGFFSLYGLTVVGDTLYGTDWYDTFSLIYATSALTVAPNWMPAPILPTTAGSVNAKASGDAIVHDTDQLFFVIYHNDVAAWPGGVWSLPLDAGTEAGADGGVAPLQLVTGEGIEALAVDDKYIYLGLETGALYTVPKDDSALFEFDVNRPFSPIVAGRGDGRVYYSGPYGVVAADRDSLATLVSYANLPIEDGGIVDDAGSDAASGGDAGSGGALDDAASDDAASDGAADDAAVPAGPPVGPLRADHFDIGESYAAWVNSATHTLYKGSGSAPPVVIPTGNVPFDRPNTDVLVDSKRHTIYLIDTDFYVRTAAISRVADDGSSAQVIAMFDDAISAVVQDENAIYFTTYGSAPGAANPPYAAVYKVAK